jgi:hypothetical protein
MPKPGKWTFVALSVGILILACVPLTQADLLGPVNNETEFFDALATASGSDSADTILVAAGTYDFSNTTLTYNNPNTGNLAIIGAGETLTILDGGGARQIININLGSGPGNTTLIVFRDLTFMNGSSPAMGGAAYIATFSQDLHVDHVRFLANESVNRGAGFYFQTSAGDLEVKNSWFFSNRTTGGSQGEGGGFYASSLTSGSMAIEESGFEKNHANAGSGGGAYLTSSSGNISVEKCSFVENDAPTGSGGALSASISGPAAWAEVENCLFAGNSANLGGAVNISAAQGALSMVNVTAVSNSSTVGAGAMYATLSTASATLEIYNSIFHGNIKGGGGGQDIYVTSNNNGQVTVQYNSYEDMTVTDPGTLTATHNIDVDPLLDSGYMLSAGSSCIDAGNSSLVGESLDLAGNDRIVDDPDTVDTGSGTPAVDLGAYEFQPAPPGGGGGGGGGCNTAGQVPGEPVLPEILWITLLAVFFMVHRWRLKRRWMLKV